MKNKPSATVYISNLSYDRDRNGLKSLFSKYGTIKNIKIIVEPKTNQSRGMAFVEMSSVKEATAAIEGLHGKIIDGRTVKANFATPMKEETKRKIERTFKSADDKKPKKKEKDLDFKEIQLAKKARNEARRNSNPLQFKVRAKK
jgi:RNA recognition motif-containing protein